MRARLVDVRYTKLRYHLWWPGNYGENTNRSHHDDRPLPPAGPSRDAILFAQVLRMVAEYRVPDSDLRREIRACADRLYPRPGVITFPAEETSAPMLEGGASA